MKLEMAFYYKITTVKWPLVYLTICYGTKNHTLLNVMLYF